MPMSFNPYQQRMPSFRRPPPRRPQNVASDPRNLFGDMGGRALSSDDQYSRAKARAMRGFRPPSFNPFMNRGIGGFSGLGGRGSRRRPQPRGRFPQSFGGFGGRGRGAPPPRRGRGRGGMFGGFPQQQRGRGRQSPFSNLFGGIGGFGGNRQFNPFMNQFGGGGFNPFERRHSESPRPDFSWLEQLLGPPTAQPTPATGPLSDPASSPGYYPESTVLTQPHGPPSLADEDSPEAPIIGPPPMAPAPPPMETTAPVMPAAPQPLAPAIPPMPPTVGPAIPPPPQGRAGPIGPTVGPPGTTITPPGPPPGVPAVTPTTPLPLPTQNSIGNILPPIGPMGPWDSCPHPEEEILLADDSWIKAKDIQVGDKVKTLTAKDFKAGEYEITRAEIIDNQPRCEVFFKDSKSIISSYSHPYAVEDKGFVEAQNIQAGDTVGDLIVTDTKPLDWGPVVSLSVDEAETYMLKGGSEDKPVAVLSHNKTPPLEGGPPQDQIDTQPLTRQPGSNVPEGFIPPSGMATMAFVDYWNPTTGETWSAPSGGWTAPEGWERGGPPGSGFNQLIPWGGAQQPPPASSPQPLPMQPLPIGQQPLLPPMPGREPRTPPFIGRGPGAPPLPSIPPVNVVQENIAREIIPPQLPVSPMQQATPNTLRAQDREPGFTQADYMRPQMTGTPATAFPSLLPHQQFAPTNLMGEPQKKALRDLLSRGRFGPGGF